MLKLKEKDIQGTCEALLQWDGWRVLRIEQNYSERKRKVVGEVGAPDGLYIRYWIGCDPTAADVLWVEWKRSGEKSTAHQKAWHAAERRRGALVVVAGEDFDGPDMIAAFKAWYAASGLQRR